MAKVKAKKSSAVELKTNSKIKDKKVLTETEETIKKFVVLVVIMIVVVVGGYFGSRAIVDGRASNTQDETVAGEIDYDVVSVGMIFNRPYKEYYVMVYDAEDPEAVHYSSVITKYQAKKDAVKLYFCDLGSALNDEYKAGEDTTNVNTNKIEELKFGSVTLLKIKNGKVDKYYEGIEKIKKTLQ